MRFGSDSPEAVCAGSLEWMDARAAALKEVFGENTHDSIEYYWVAATWEDWPCSLSTGGCTFDGVVYSTQVPHEHELVHAIRRDRLPAVFEEGLCEVFGDIGWTPDPVPREQLVDIFEQGEPREITEYSRVGHFVAFLLETHGLQPLRRFGAISGYHDDDAKIRASFAKAYGFSLDQALAEYEGFPECGPLKWMDKRIACAEPGLPLSPTLSGGVEFSMDLDCAEPRVLGPFADFMYTETVFEIDPQVGLPVWIDLIGDLGPEVRAALFSCEGGCADSTAVWLDEEGATAQIELPSGRYVLRLFRPLDDPGELGIALQF